MVDVSQTRRHRDDVTLHCTECDAADAPVTTGQCNDRAWTVAGEEDEGDADTHDSGLGDVLVGGRRREGVGGPGAERADDADVAEEDNDEGQETRECEADPRPHVVLVVGVPRRHHTRVYVVVSRGDCVQSVCVLQQGSDRESGGDHVRLPGSLERAHGETHAQVALDGEGDQDPDGGRRQARLQEPDKSTRQGARVRDGEVPGVPEVPVDEAERQHDGISRGQQPQVHASRRLAVATAS